ncbi:hypothetical protein Y032_0234g3157 [Ancylostoma ceylanicum]|uniref:Uncharacterized protein n=1 Tax=Ancylostoma ceylanicum TaxID=53326 RepID=A0A016SEY2_9BILA|nr:hypothetical protein Y032_0234g3157 [Ancylostoma ceylanicum]
MSTVNEGNGETTGEEQWVTTLKGEKGLNKNERKKNITDLRSTAEFLKFQRRINEASQLYPYIHLTNSRNGRKKI